MPKIKTIRLRCSDPHAQSQFYCDVLGMNDYGDGVVGYGGEQAKLHVIKSNGNYIPQPNHTYWKIALGVPDIDLAYQQLLARGIQVAI